MAKNDAHNFGCQGDIRRFEWPTECHQIGFAALLTYSSRVCSSEEPIPTKCTRVCRPRPDYKALCPGSHVVKRRSPSPGLSASSYLNPSHGAQRMCWYPALYILVLGREREAVILRRCKLKIPRIRTAYPVTDTQTISYGKRSMGWRNCKWT